MDRLQCKFNEVMGETEEATIGANMVPKTEHLCIQLDQENGQIDDKMIGL